MENFTSLYQQRRYVECENACRSLLLANPKNVQVRHTLILALEAQGKVKAAINECETLADMVQRKEDKINVLEHQGELASKAKDFVTAIKSYSRSLELDNKRHRTWIALGACQYETNDYEACTKSLLQGINDPELHDVIYSEALYFLTESNPRLTYSDVSKLSPRIKRPIESPQYFFSVGTLYERQSDYKLALASYDDGNRLLRARKPYNPQLEIQTIRRYIKIFSLDVVSQTQQVNSDKNPTPIFIVGMPRTGSSLIEQMLGHHSKISPQGEAKWLPDAFAKNLGDVTTEAEFREKCLSSDFISKIRHQYFQALDDKSKPFVTDKLPGNFSFLFLIKLAFPDAFVIKTARDRIANIWSCYKTPLYHGHSYSHSLEETAEYFDLVEAATDRWRDLFGERFMEVSYEKFVTDAVGGISEILTRVGLDLEDACINYDSSSRIVHTASKNQVTKPVYQDANDSSVNFLPLIQDRISV